MNIPHDAEYLMQMLPKEVLDAIEFEMIVWSGLEFIKMGPHEPTESQLRSFTNRSMDKHLQLLRQAKVKFDSDRGAS